MLGHLHNGWQVDQAILSEEDRVVVIRFGHDWDPTCMKMDEVLYSIAEKVKNFAVIYLVDITEVPDFNKMYELYDPCTVMFFFRNKHIMIDLGTGNNNKINWPLEDKQEMIDIIETVYRGARKGRVKIMEKLNSLTFQKITRIVTAVDSQPMFDGGVLINVLGRLKCDEDPPHLYMQTFVLKPLGDSFYVQHDIFRLGIHDIA